jgi:hypothetical protein
MFPNDFNTKLKHGIGFDEDKSFRFDYFKQYIIDMFTHMRCTLRLPMDWIRTYGVFIDKLNGKVGMDSQRMLKIYDTFGNAWAAGTWNDSAHDTPPPHEHGFHCRRRRESAIAVCHIMMYRLCKAGWSFVTTFFDMTNAFESTKHAILDDVLTNNLNTTEAFLLQQRHNDSTVFVDGPTAVSLCMLHWGDARDAASNL